MRRESGVRGRGGTYCIESVVYDMLQILAHSNLPHQLIFIAVHPCKLAHMSKGVLKTICKLERIHITQAILNMGIHYQFSKTQNLTAKMKSIAKSREHK